MINIYSIFVTHSVKLDGLRKEISGVGKRIRGGCWGLGKYKFINIKDCCRFIFVGMEHRRKFGVVVLLYLFFACEFLLCLP